MEGRLVDAPWDELREKYHAAQRPDGASSNFEPYIVNREFIPRRRTSPPSQVFAHGLDFLDAQPRRRQLAAPDRDLRPARALPRARPLQGRLPHRLERPDPRLAALRPASTSCPRRATSCAPTTTRYLALCDHLLGKILDDFDEHDLWKDTALVVTTDHGFLLGEHDFWAKNRMTIYEEIAHIPLFVHDPRAPRGRRASTRLTQSIDIAPTLLDFFGAGARRRRCRARSRPSRDDAPRRGDLRLLRRRGERHRRALHLPPLPATTSRPRRSTSTR